MNLLYIYIIVISVASVAVIVITIASTIAGGAKHNRMLKLKASYIRQVVSLLQGEEQYAARIVATTPTQRRALCEAIYLVMSHTYGANSVRLKRTVEENHLEEFMLNRISTSSGYRRAQWLMTMSSIPISLNSIEYIEKYINSSNHAIRIAALTTFVAANPQMAIRRIASLEYRLMPIDLAHIIALLRRGILPIAYEPLLASRNPNLCLLGITIVRNFGIDMADKQLHNIISESNDKTVLREAILTLAALGRPLGRIKIRERIRAMSHHERKAFCRHLATEGYSTQALRTLFSEREMHYAEALIKSYKRELGCQQYTQS
ncbi:MAG: hypothetical protein IKY82_05465 [Alistipes sp.]|nr:hypothetical protein [Alistipes sp.]